MQQNLQPDLIVWLGWNLGPFMSSKMWGELMNLSELLSIFYETSNSTGLVGFGELTHVQGLACVSEHH